MDPKSERSGSILLFHGFILPVSLETGFAKSEFRSKGLSVTQLAPLTKLQET